MRCMCCRIRFRSWILQPLNWNPSLWWSLCKMRYVKMERQRDQSQFKQHDPYPLCTLAHWISEEELDLQFLCAQEHYRQVGGVQVKLVLHDRIVDVVRSLVKILNRHPEIVELNLSNSNIHECTAILSRLQHVRRLNLRLSGIIDRVHPKVNALWAMEAYRPWLSPCVNVLFAGKNRQKRMAFLEQLKADYPVINRQLKSTDLIEINGETVAEKTAIEEVLLLLQNDGGRCPGVAPLFGDFIYLDPVTVDASLGDLKELPIGHFERINLKHTVIGDSTCRYLLKLHDEGDPREPTFVNLFDPS